MSRRRGQSLSARPCRRRMVEVEYERGAVRVVNRRRSDEGEGDEADGTTEEDGARLFGSGSSSMKKRGTQKIRNPSCWGGVQANTAVPARVCGCGCGRVQADNLDRWWKWKSRQHSGVRIVEVVGVDSYLWCLVFGLLSSSCRQREVEDEGGMQDGHDPGELMDGTWPAGELGCWGAGVGAGMEDSGRPPPPARSLEWRSTPPPKQLPEHLHLCGSDTYLPPSPATVLEARPFASFKGVAAASCIVSSRRRQTDTSDRLPFSFPAKSCRGPRMHGARNTLRTAHGGSTERRAVRTVAVAASTVPGTRISRTAAGLTFLLFHPITWISSLFFLPLWWLCWTRSNRLSRRS